MSEPVASTSSPAPEAEFQFPSVDTANPLVNSYTFHSIDHAAAQSADKGKATQTRDAPKAWMLGVDEAGRGPVLGPQVYGVAFCPVEYSEELRSHGFADSKTLTDPRREELFKVIIDLSEQVHYACTVMSPHDISRGMLRRTPYNLNAQSHDVTISLIRDVIAKGYNLAECYVDTVGIAADYQRKLELLFPAVRFTVASKADVTYPIVSAASIVAKVTRDRLIESWTFLEGDQVADREGASLFGSGYPSDPKTVAWLENNFDPVFGYPNVARFSWQPVKNMLMKKGAKVKFDDEPATIQKYFSGKPQGPNRTPLWKDFGLSSVASF